MYFVRLSVFVVIIIITGVQAGAQIIADSVVEFSGTQGQDSWYYGYIEPSSSMNIQLMTEFVPDGNPITGDIWYVSEGSYWTSLYATGGSPNSDTGQSGGRIPIDQWAVRRWLSEVDGQITISGNIYDIVAQTGDGILARILVDGTEIYSYDLAASDTVGTNYSVTAMVNLGSTVDFVIDPKVTGHSDAAAFTSTISVVPEPMSSLLFIAGGATLGIRRLIKGKPS
jgi:hypothetical protein